MPNANDLDPRAPAFDSGAGGFKSAAPIGLHTHLDHWHRPGPLGVADRAAKVAPVTGSIVAGGPLSEATVTAVNLAGAKVPSEWRRFIAYADRVKVGGSLAWRANNPGNLRTASTKIGSVSGAVGTFAVFATLEEGRTAQRALYLSRYGDMKVEDAINKLTPPTENDTAAYLDKLKGAGVALDKDVKSQIDSLMKGVEANEGLIEGVEVMRLP